MEDLESLFKFIRLSPFDSGRVFQKCVTDPLKNGELSGLKALHTLLRSIGLRRTTDVLEALPAVSERIQTLELSPQEQMQYNEINQELGKEIETLTCSGNSKNAYQPILKAIMRLRQLCNHGTSAVSARETSCEISALEAQFGLQPSTECSQCSCPLEVSSRTTSQQDSTTCCHIWCQDCFSFEKSNGNVIGGKRKKWAVVCPLCGHPVTSATSVPAATATATATAAAFGPSTPVMDSGCSSQTEMDFSFDTFSTKVTAVVNDIECSEGKG